MNKKITAVTLTALMVLTMFTAMVPSALGAVEVTAPHEFMGAVGSVPGSINLTSADNPGILYYDIDDQAGAETLDLYIDTNLDIDAANFKYTTTIYQTDEGDANVAWLGAAYYVVANDTSEWWICEKLQDDDEDDDYLLRVGESLSLAEGMSISVMEIDVDGNKAWITLSKDGEEIGNEVVATDSDDEDPFFVFEADLDDDGDEDDEVMNFTVETVFAGMNTNMVKINNIDLISMDVLLIEDGDTDLFSDFEIDLGTDPTLTIELEDSDDEISLTSDGVKDIFGDRISIRINEDDNYAAVVTTITEPGTYELMGAVGSVPGPINLTSADNPSLLYYDIDEQAGAETLDMYIDTNLDIDAANFKYTTTIYQTDEGDANVAWLGAAYYVVANDTSEWWICEKLQDDDEDDDYLLRVGESLSLAEGMSISVMEIDVDGNKAWITLSKDGEEIGNEVVATDSDDEDPFFVFEADLDDDGDEDDEVMNFTVETVFAGMNTNMVKINNIDLISMDVLLIEDGDTDLFSDFEIDLGTDPTLTIELEDSDDEISLTSDGVKDIFGDSISVRINDDDDFAAVVKTVIIGGPGPTEAPTAVVTEVATDEPTNETGVEPGAPTEGPTADTGETEVPTEVPTEDEVPGFEAVFAIAGLLAVAYLVLRQRE